MVLGAFGVDAAQLLLLIEFRLSPKARSCLAEVAIAFIVGILGGKFMGFLLLHHRIHNIRVLLLPAKGVEDPVHVALDYIEEALRELGPF